MEKDRIIDQIKEHKQLSHLNYKLKEDAQRFTDTLFYTLFDYATDLEKNLGILEGLFTELVDLACWETDKRCSKVWEDYVEGLPKILRTLNLDAAAIFKNDPAARSLEEVYLAYPGFYAIAIFRLSHELHIKGFPIVPRLMTEYAHQITGVDINPGAQIGEHFFMDHATGIVIGETAVIKDHVKLYQGVTLGALSVDKDMRDIKRHPTIENGVTIYANATILGGNTVIGENSTIGGNVWLTSSVPAYSLVTHRPDIHIKELKKR
ncbi:serine O-acetyltransferase EpsC [Flavimarina sp. Hel_I_48]|uniref:serine O-acetyltransferase EpsC n=1 Tax=Flavimarina sp. Hel_I_48 TaxID=1392488 RepID=UPI0004DF05B0|nr:serine O-acetyltransferase EpsC [Flavimarina sp. Hel_I_48]